MLHDAEPGNPDECSQCAGSGFLDHDCGEDTCCCENPEGDTCPLCQGFGSVSVPDAKHSDPTRRSAAP